MDREKLEKDADRWTHFYNTEMKTEPVPYDERFKKGFIKGTDWLMQQPLSERLSEAEREKIKAFYSEASMFAEGEDVNEIEPLSHYFGRKLQLEMVLGTDLFKRND